jgi:hypothetical protein
MMAMAQRREAVLKQQRSKPNSCKLRELESTHVRAIRVPG